jgi:hypothetical protein
MGKKTLRKYSRSKRNNTFRKTRKNPINHLKNRYKKSQRKTQRKNRIIKMRGGFGPGAGPVGYPLDGGNTSTWPGVSGNDQGMGNHYPLSASGIPSGPLDPPISSRGIPELFSSSMKYGGGGKRKRRGNRQKGGGLIPQGLLNLGRSIQYNASSFASKFMGDVNHPVNPMPTKDQVIDSSNANSNNDNNNNININRVSNTNANSINNMNKTNFSSLRDIAKTSYNKVAAI